MGLCYDGGFRAPTLALALQTPGRLSLPLGSRRGLNPQESVGGEAGHSLLTSSPYKCGCLVRRPSVRGGVRESLADLLRQSLPAKGGNRGCWSGCFVRSAAENQTDRRASTASLIDLGTGTATGTGHHRPGYRHYRPAPPPVTCIGCIGFNVRDTPDTASYTASLIKM